jgi:hypothetical protein
MDWLNDLLAKVSPDKGERIKSLREQDEKTTHPEETGSNSNLHAQLESLTSKFSEQAESFQREICALTAGMASTARQRPNQREEERFGDIFSNDEGPGAPPNFPPPAIPIAKPLGHEVPQHKQLIPIVDDSRSEMAKTNHPVHLSQLEPQSTSTENNMHTLADPLRSNAHTNLSAAERPTPIGRSLASIVISVLSDVVENVDSTLKSRNKHPSPKLLTKPYTLETNTSSSCTSMAVRAAVADILRDVEKWVTARQGSKKRRALSKSEVSHVVNQVSEGNTCAYIMRTMCMYVSHTCICMYMMRATSNESTCICMYIMRATSNESCLTK